MWSSIKCGLRKPSERAYKDKHNIAVEGRHTLDRELSSLDRYTVPPHRVCVADVSFHICILRWTRHDSSKACNVPSGTLYQCSRLYLAWGVP